MLADELVAEGSYHPTYFEMLFSYGNGDLCRGRGGLCDFGNRAWRKAGCDYSGRESGSLRDHIYQSGSYAVLGNTVREIAGEKAGIIVPGVPVIYDGNDKDAAEVIAAKAKELGSPAYKVVQAGAKVLGNNKDGIDFPWRRLLWGYQVPYSFYCMVSGDERVSGAYYHGSAERQDSGDAGTAAGRNCKYQMAGQNGDYFARCDRGWCT